MKIRLFAIFLFAILLSAESFAQTDQTLENLYRGKDFFKLRDEVAAQNGKNTRELKFYRGAVANKFNRLKQSIAALESYIKSAVANRGAAAKDANLRDAHELLADGYLKTYQYARAAEHYKILIERFRDELSAEQARDFGNSYKLWSALAGVAPQTISFAGDTRLQMTRDKARLMNVPVEINSQTMNFVFDTGANISTVNASTAAKLDLKIIEADISVGSSTDKRVQSRLGIAPEMKIGQATLRNVVFLVMDDSALSFPQINYQINGIVGFPVIEAFRRFTLTRADELFIPAKAEEKTKAKTEQNMCLDDLMPILQATYNNRRMSFALDTGAQKSSFFPAFYKAEESEIKKLSRLQNVKIGGAGGYRDIPAYVLETLSLTVSGKNAQLKKVEVLVETTNEDSRYFYGNLGQDVIRQFDKMTLDFEAMSLVFE